MLLKIDAIGLSFTHKELCSLIHALNCCAVDEHDHCGITPQYYEIQRLREKLGVYLKDFEVALGIHDKPYEYWPDELRPF